MNDMCYAGQHAWLRAPQANTHCSSDHSISHDHLRVRHSTGIRYRGVRWETQALVLSTGSLQSVKGSIKNSKIHGWQLHSLMVLPFISSLKSLKFFLPCSLCPCHSLLAGIRGNWSWPSLYQPFFPPSSSLRSPCYPATANEGQVTPLSQGMALRNWPLLRKSCPQISGPEKSPGTGLLPNKAESYRQAIKRHLFI